MKFLKNIVNIKRGEGKMVLTFFCFSFFMVAMGLVAKTAKDAYFLSRFEKSILPLMFLGVAVVIAPVLTYYTKVSKQLSPRLLFMITSSIFISSFIIVQPMITGWVVPTVYIWIELVVGIMIIQFWGYAAESFEPQQAKRLFGIIGGGGSFAVMLVGMNLKPFVKIFDFVKDFEIGTLDFYSVKKNNVSNSKIGRPILSPLPTNWLISC